MKKDTTQKSTSDKNSVNNPLQNNDTSSEETIKRGNEAIRARQAVDHRPEEIKKKEEKKDAEKWRNEG